MKQWIAELDRILRGHATDLPALARGRIEIDVRRLVIMLVLLGATYGFFMGWFAVLNRYQTPAHVAVPVTTPADPTALKDPDAPSPPPPPVERTLDREYRQVIASMIKVPLIFLLTLFVTFPSLYVFNALVGSSLDMIALGRLLLTSFTVMLAVLASFSPIVGFFTLTTESYSFILLLNVAIYTVAGVLGLKFLLRTLQRLTLVIHGDGTDSAEGGSPAAEGAKPASPRGALDALRTQVRGQSVTNVFRIWIVVFSLVGAQMAWVLRPFVGNPELPFEWLRPREGDFFTGVITAIRNLLGM